MATPFSAKEGRDLVTSFIAVCSAALYSAWTNQSTVFCHGSQGVMVTGSSGSQSQCNNIAHNILLTHFKITTLYQQCKSHLQLVLHILRFHYQHSCWQCSGSSLHLTFAHWGWWGWTCLLLESSPHHSHLLFYAPTGSLVASFQWLGWWALLGCQKEHPLHYVGEW